MINYLLVSIAGPFIIFNSSLNEERKKKAKEDPEFAKLSRKEQFLKLRAEKDEKKNLSNYKYILY